MQSQPRFSHWGTMSIRKNQFLLLLFFCCGVVAGAALNLNCPSIKVFWRFIWNRLSQLNAGCAIEHFESMSPRHRKKPRAPTFQHMKNQRDKMVTAQLDVQPSCSQRKWMEMMTKIVNSRKKASDIFLLFAPFFLDFVCIANMIFEFAVGRCECVWWNNRRRENDVDAQQ